MLYQLAVNAVQQQQQHLRKKVYAILRRQATLKHDIMHDGRALAQVSLGCDVPCSSQT
jgi:hypothetical protein